MLLLLLLLWLLGLIGHEDCHGCSVFERNGRVHVIVRLHVIERSRLLEALRGCCRLLDVLAAKFIQTGRGSHVHFLLMMLLGCLVVLSLVVGGFVVERARFDHVIRRLVSKCRLLLVLLSANGRIPLRHFYIVIPTRIFVVVAVIAALVLIVHGLRVGLRAWLLMVMKPFVLEAPLESDVISAICVFAVI